MPYEYTNGWTWVGDVPEPIIGETKEVYTARTGVGMVEFAEAAQYVPPVIEPTPEPERDYEVLAAGLSIPWWGIVSWVWDFFFGGDENGGTQMSNGTVDLYGHEGVVMNGGGVPVGGPGVPEPPSQMVAKQWKTKAFSNTVGEYWVYFFRLVDGRMMCYNAAKRTWKMWRPKKPIVLYKGSITLSQAVRTQRMLDRLWKTVAKRTKALKLA